MKRPHLFLVALLCLSFTNGNAQTKAAVELGEIFARWFGSAGGKTAAELAAEVAAREATIVTAEWAAASVERSIVNVLSQASIKLSDAEQKSLSNYLVTASLEERKTAESFFRAYAQLSPLERQYLNRYVSREFWMRDKLMGKSVTELRAMASEEKIIEDNEDLKKSNENPVNKSRQTRQLQKKLRAKGYDIKVDGKFGKATKEAIGKALNDDEFIELSDEAALEKAVGKTGAFIEKTATRITQYDADPRFGFPTRLLFDQGSLLFSEKRILDKRELNQIDKFYKGFLAKFNYDNKEMLDGAFFITFCRTPSHRYVGFHFPQPKFERTVGRLIELANVKKIQQALEFFAKRGETKRIYVYGDDLFNMGDQIRQVSAKHSKTMVYRNTAMNKPFNETEAALKALVNKKLNSATVSFLNGTPTSPEEAIFQSFSAEDADILKSLSSEIHAKAAAKTTTIISDKEHLRQELTAGENDVLFIVAHCDAENIYFGADKISIEEVKSWPQRTGRKKPRTAILLSCLTGDLFSKILFKNDTQSFAELFIEKKFFDWVIAPPSTIHGDDVLGMIGIMDKFPVLELPRQFDKIVERGSMLGIGKISDRLFKDFLAICMPTKVSRQED